METKKDQAYGLVLFGLIFVVFPSILKIISPRRNFRPRVYSLLEMHVL